MKRLLLVRHAKAAPPEPGATDFGRPLTARGQRDTAIMGQRMTARDERPTLMVSSPALRARETAERLAHETGYPGSAIALDPRLYLADAATILAVIAAQASGAPCLAIVGHNPGLSNLARRLIPSLPLEELPTCAVVTIDVDAADWSSLGATPATLRRYDYPKKTPD